MTLQDWKPKIRNQKLETRCRKRKTENCMKGQIWSMDLISAATVLAIIILFFILMWNNLSIRWNSSNEYRQMQTDALFASEAIMVTSGEPNSWETKISIDESIDAIGLANERNELSAAKIEKLIFESPVDYDIVRYRLGVQKYELGIRIEDFETNQTYYEFGIFATGTENVVVIERLGILNDSVVKIFVEVWK